MGVLIAGAAVGVAGGIMGGIQKGQQQQAAYLAQKVETERNNFFGAMAHDRETEALANANVNSRIKDEKTLEAALTNSFYANYKTAEQYQDNKAAIYQQSRASLATMQSQVTGKGVSSGGTAAALQRQAKQAERNAYASASKQKFDKEAETAQQFENALATRDMGISRSDSQAFLPGSTGIAPSSSGAMLNGILGGVNSGIGMASGLKGLGF